MSEKNEVNFSATLQKMPVQKKDSSHSLQIHLDTRYPFIDPHLFF